MMHSGTTASESISLVAVAEVLEVDQENRMLHVRQASGGSDQFGWARMAMPGDVFPQAGHRVVLAGDLADEAFVIGCLTPLPQTRLTTAEGVIAEVVKSADGRDSLRVRTPNDQLLFEFNSSNNTARVNIPEGNLDVTTPEGGISFQAQGNIRLEGESLELAARQNLLLRISRGIASAATRLRMLPGRIQIGTQQLDVSAEHLESQTQTNRTVSKEITMTSKRHEITAERFDTTAETVTERVGNIYRTVRDLVQLQAGRYRTYVSGLSHFRSKKAFFSSEESMNIDGDKVNIG